jgi:hypothetical protein
MIWDDWLKQLEALSPNAEEWTSIGEFLSKIEGLAARKNPQQRISIDSKESVVAKKGRESEADQLPENRAESADSSWLKNIYSMADVEPDDR